MSDPYIIDQQNFQYLNCKTSCYIDYYCSVNFHFTLLQVFIKLLLLSLLLLLLCFIIKLLLVFDPAVHPLTCSIVLYVISSACIRADGAL